MTSRERLLTALRNGIPDRVPVAPDISMYVPMRYSGCTLQDFWTGPKNGLPHWQAYLDAADHYGLDAWTAPVFGLPLIYEDSPVEWRHESRVDPVRDVLVSTAVVRTPAGDLTQETVCYRGDQPSATVKLIKDLPRDLPRFRYTQPLPRALDVATLDTYRNACQQRGHAFGVTIPYPGYHMWSYWVQGGVATLAYAAQDTPAVLDEWLEWDLERGTREVELALQAGLDFILFGGSGTITMASPALAERCAIPALKRWSAMAKAADLPTMLHSCGKTRALADLLVAHTDVGMLNPVEPPPMGDVDLAELKETHGQRLALMGNLHTTDVMLLGSVQDVRRESLKAIRAAGANGGFILSTGDQCGRDTPDENLREMVRVAAEFGSYPLDMDRLTAEIRRLETTATASVRA
ncbi:MAG: uroporphyrinogen decarboxylase family protein [Armatimonadota bacterium]